MKKNIILLSITAIILSAFVFSLFGCSALSVASTTAAGTTMGGMEAWVFVPAAGARNIIVKSASKNTPKVLPPSGYVALSGATLSVVGYNKTATTGEDGNAYLGGLADGTYVVTVGKDGYETFAYTDVTVTTGVVTNVGGSSGIQSQTSSAPGILDLSAYKGPAGIPITITGSNFGSTQVASTVTVNAASASIVSWSDTRIVCTIPASTSIGTASIKVTVGSTASNSLGFTIVSTGTAGYPNIMGINPITGQRGTSVTITGTNFGSSQGSSVVSFSGNTANSITSWSDTSIVCGAPYTTIDGGVAVVVNGISSNAISFAAGSWSAMSSTGTNNSLRAVWGSASNNVYAVGGSGTALNYNGSSWSPVSAISTPNQLNTVWGSSASNIFVMGNSSFIGIYNGFYWAIDTTSVVGVNFNGVWGSSPTSVFTVGAKGANGKIYHYNGTIWSDQATATGKTLHAVWGASSDEVFVVGQSGRIFYFDGQSWTGPMSLPPGFATSRLNAVWGSDVNDVFAVGQSGKILHYNGTLWSEMNSGTGQNLNGVWGTASNNVYAVGDGGTILYYNGTSGWTPMTSPTLNSLRGIWGTSVSDIFAVGDSGTILHYTQ